MFLVFQLVFDGVFRLIASKIVGLPPLAEFDLLSPVSEDLPRFEPVLLAN